MTLCLQTLLKLAVIDLMPRQQLTEFQKSLGRFEELLRLD